MVPGLDQGLGERAQARHLLGRLVQERLRVSQRPRALTGAGASAESGIPVFRGADGWWRNRRAEELATPEAFSRDPKTVWEWYDYRRDIIAKAKPNLCHEFLARMENIHPRWHTITQNVDGLHQRAGSSRVLELHGSIWQVRCTACDVDYEDERVPIPILPSCRTCGGLVRPGVVWFGESLPQDVLQRAFALAEDSDLFFVVGTSGVVEPAASLARVAKSAGAFVVEINPEPSALTPAADAFLQGKAGEVFERLLGLG
ncbi:MAG: NAD-dependent deacylase [Elusimicrobia bacterium]|nr:NAD-dependent deacylase [Elusimicrobiota bacterium]